MKLALALLAVTVMAAERKPFFPAGPKPAGPYSPGLMVNGFLYVSGQGARDAAGKLPDTIEAQTTQVLENVKTIVEAGGLTMKDVIYAQIYLADMANLQASQKVFSTYFPEHPPAQSLIGVKRMPTDTPVEISVVASKNPGKRVYVPGVSFTLADQHLKTKDLKMTDIGYANIYFTSKVPFERVQEIAKKNLKPEAAIVYVPVNELPAGQALLITGVVDPTAVYSVHTGAQAGAILDDIKKDLKAAGVTMDNVVASNVYVGNLDGFADMNKIYASFFTEPQPTRTTVQPLTPAPGTGNTISVMAVR